MLLGGCGGDATPAGDDTGVADVIVDTVDDLDVGDDGGTEVEDTTPPADRAPGERRARTARCDATDATACLLPWPSNAFVRLDPDAATGLRVTIAADAPPGDEDVSALLRADGFSRVSPIVLGFPEALAPLAEGAAPVRLFVAEPGDAHGTEVPVWYERFDSVASPVSALVTYPTRPLAPASEHLVVALDDLAYASGGPPPADRSTLLALGRATAETAEERALVAYHAPARQLLAAAGIDLDRVVRVWDFTTRSAGDPRADLLAMRAACLAAVDDGDASPVIDAVTLPEGGSVAAIVKGRIVGLPHFGDADGRLARDAAGALVATGTYEAPFRAVVPAGEGDYHVVMYAHGTGGNVDDSLFDALVAEHHAAKVGLEIDGWTDTSLGETVSDLLSPVPGADRVTNRVLHAEAGGSAVLHALAGPLGDALAADTLGGLANPAAGRRPDTAAPIWAGGSLGGVVGLVFGHLEPSIAGGLLNVPGAGLTHWLPRSNIYGLLEAALGERFPTTAELNLVAAMAQGAFDPMDGANWADARPDRPPFLVQQSIGDPVLPNVGSDVVATSLGAVQVGAVLRPIAGVVTVEAAENASALTQYKVPEDPEESPLAVHGFAARNGLAGQAARAQLIDFLESVWAGAPRITVPALCAENTPPDSCDFSAP
ncbi:MAG: hypothetical protein EP329_10525 [Deltaproteobacteria bacterium]|nr:MAG: hypothetical protein EP329_10525 [Deltaproteobacteria bacterium]